MKKSVFILTMLLGLVVNAHTADTTKVDNFHKTDEILAKVVDKALTVAEKTGNFVIEQSPDVLQQFYAWHIGSAIFWMLISVGIFLLARYLPYLWLDKDNTFGYSFLGRYEGNGEGAMSAWILCIVGSSTALILFLINLYDLMYILIAPKLYLIDYFIQLK